MGFHLSPFGESHTPAAGLAKQVINLTILNEYLFESAVPSCIFMALLFVLPSEKSQWDRRLLALFFAFPTMYFFYWHRDSYLGPRFIYVSLLAAIPLTVRGISLTAALLNQPTSRAAVYKPSLVFGFFAAAFFLYSALAGIPYRFHNYATGFKSMKVDIVKEAHQAGIESGLIFTPVSFGSRLISQIRAAGLPAAETEQAYRTTDHCLLFELIQRARRTGMTVEQIEAEVERLRRFPVTKFPKANGDRTLRLRPDIRPDDACLAEIEYDHLGYSLFLPHLIADSPALSPPFVIATDMRRENRKLIEKYPNLKPYIYRKGTFIPIGQRDNIEKREDAAE